MRLGEAPVRWSMPGGSVELLSATQSVEDIDKAPQARLCLTVEYIVKAAWRRTQDGWQRTPMAGQGPITGGLEEL